MRFTLYRSNCLEVPENCTYPHKVEVTGKDSLIEAVKHDYVCAKYQGNYRSNDNFIGSDCLPVDCDNDHSDDPEEWVYPSKAAKLHGRSSTSSSPLIESPNPASTAR